MTITPLARSFIAFVSLAVIGWVVWERQRPGPTVGGEAQVERGEGGQAPASGAPAEVGSAPAGGVPGMVAIAGGSFLAGKDRAPASVGDYFIDRTEVTNSQYKAFVAANPTATVPVYFQDAGYMADHGELPVVGVSWEDARSFCAWSGKRLPTGLEWERAARGTDGREWPWGNELARDKAWIVGGDAQALASAAFSIPTLPVNDPQMAGDASPDGVKGMAGNAAEWTADAAGPGEYLVRGGSWASYQVTDAVTYRATPTRGDLKATRVGFRCAASPADVSTLATRAAGLGRLAKIRAAGVLRVGAEPETPPMLVSGPGGGYAGFDYEIAKAVADRLGVAVEIVPGRYSELPGALSEGNFDVIISGYTPDPGLTNLAWSTSYLEFGLCLVVKKGSPIKRVSDLAGKKVGVFNDPVAERVVRQLAPAAQSITTYEDGYFQLVEGGALDAFIYDFPYAQAELAPFDGRLVIAEYNLSEQRYAVGVPAGAADLLAEVNGAIEGFRASPAYKKLVRTWLGSARAIEDFAPGQKVYTVKAGDSLSAIAKRTLGDVGAWPRIWEVNRHRIGNPDLIDVGMKIALPE